MQGLIWVNEILLLVAFCWSIASIFIGKNCLVCNFICQDIWLVSDKLETNLVYMECTQSNHDSLYWLRNSHDIKLRNFESSALNWTATMLKQSKGSSCGCWSSSSSWSSEIKNGPKLPPGKRIFPSNKNTTDSACKLHSDPSKTRLHLNQEI